MQIDIIYKLFAAQLTLCIVYDTLLFCFLFNRMGVTLLVVVVALILTLLVPISECFTLT